MNKLRREMIIAAAGKLEEAKADIETATEEEQEYFDNMPESLQGSEKGEQAEEVVQELEQVVSELEDLISRVEDQAQ